MDPVSNFSKISQLFLTYKDDLIRGRKKLSLDTISIHNINELVDKGNENQSLPDKEKLELKSFTDILGKITGLKISQKNINFFLGLIDIKLFKKIKFLILSKVSVDRLASINLFKLQLESLVCTRCENCLDLFCDDNIWNDLKVLTFSYGNISDIPEDLFKNAPWIQHLNLSFNNLVSVEGLQTLHHLKYLDLSFNHLDMIPILSKNSCKNLEVFLISNNHLTSLSGVRYFVNLRGFDASDNCILDRFSIKDLFALSLLQWVNLLRNPLTSNTYHRLNTVYNIGTQIAPHQFVLDNVSLSPVEQSFLGMYNKSRYRKKEVDQIRPKTSKTGSFKDAGSVSERKTSKVREVVIEEFSNQPKSLDVSVASVQVEHEVEVHVETKKQVERLRKTYGKDWLHSQYGGAYVQDLMGLRVENIAVNNSSVQGDSASSTPLASQQSDIPYSSTPENSVKPFPKLTEEMEEEKGEVKTALVTVHAVDESKVNDESKIDDETSGAEGSNNERGNKSEGEHGYYSIGSESNSEKISNSASEEQFTSATEELKDEETEREDNGEKSNEEDISGEEILWIVERVDSSSNKNEDIFLILLENELRERSMSSGRTIIQWPLSSVQSCIKSKIDPVTIEIEFDTFVKEKQFRTYIMEYADAQVLLKKMNDILESRPLSAMNQSIFKCLKCSSLFSQSISSKLVLPKPLIVLCPVCNSNLVVEMEEPRLPTNKVMSEKSISNSPSQSSIAVGLENGCATEGSRITDVRPPSSSKCSAASLEQTNKPPEGRALEVHTPRKCESDIEIISNPSESSIEVLDETSRYGGSTPRRKISSEERQLVKAQTQLVTVPEAQPAFANLTESSSSGSMSESVVTAYEGHTLINKKLMNEDSLPEEAGEEVSPSADELLHTSDSTNDGQTEGDRESLSSVDLKEQVNNIYPANFREIDHRIKLFLYQSVFEIENEEPECLIRCHLWKTGGLEFPACVVLTLKSVYILSHSTNATYGDDASEWLSKLESFKLSDIKTIFPLVWYQGAGVQVKNIYFLMLLQDRTRTENLFSFLSGSSLKIKKLQKRPNNKTEMILQQLALSCDLQQTSEDPTVNLFTICSKILIYKDGVCQDTMRLVGLLVTNSELHIVLGDLSWLTGSSNQTPTIHCSQIISNITHIEKFHLELNIHFLEIEGEEEIWCISLVTRTELLSVITTVQRPWEEKFSLPLQVTNK